jgi:hypothetical protein
MDKEIRKLLESLDIQQPAPRPEKKKKTVAILWPSILGSLIIGTALGFSWHFFSNHHVVCLYPQESNEPAFFATSSHIPSESWLEQMTIIKEPKLTQAAVHYEIIQKISERKQALLPLQKEVEQSLRFLARLPSYEQGAALEAQIKRFLSIDRTLTAQIVRTIDAQSIDPEELKISLSNLGIGNGLLGYTAQLTAAQQIHKQYDDITKAIGNDASITALAQHLRSSLHLLQRMEENPYTFEETNTTRQKLLKNISERLQHLSQGSTAKKLSDEEKKSIAVLQTFIPNISETVWQKFDATRLPVATTRSALQNENHLVNTSRCTSSVHSIFSPEVYIPKNV